MRTQAMDEKQKENELIELCAERCCEAMDLDALTEYAVGMMATHYIEASEKEKQEFIQDWHDPLEDCSTLEDHSWKKGSTYVEEEADRQREAQNDAWANEPINQSESDMY